MVDSGTQRRSFLLQGSPFFAAPTTVNAGAKVSIKLPAKQS